MAASILLLFHFAIDLGRRLARDAYFQALGLVLLLMVLAGTLFFWLVDGHTFLEALAYSALTLAMNSPYGSGLGPRSTGGVIFNIVYVLMGVGVFLLFVLEAGKTMVKSYEDFLTRRAQHRASRRTQPHDASKPGDAT